MKSKLTQKRLKELLYYNSKTGIFRWRISRRNIKKGDIAGYKKKRGYIVIQIDYKFYKAHRLVWLYENGYFPEPGLDHRDRIKHHNWISNLREASQQCNMRNYGNPKDNTSGVKGVYWNKAKNKWNAQIVVNKKNFYLGLYKDFSEAACARLAAEQCLDWSDCDSSSPAFKYVQKMLNEEERF